MRKDKYYMRLALALAKKGFGKTSPNPAVGAVIVKGGRIISKGYHKRAGLDHAEIAALKAAKEAARGAALYVTLEPCNHFGRTPPCTDAVIKSGIRKVVAAMRDPNPFNNGKGFMRLRRAGIKVVTGVMEEEAKRLNESFAKYITKKVPFITVKVAQSLDGKIATKNRDSKWISNEGSRRYAHILRSQADAVMVGAETVIKDNPLLTNRVKGCLPAGRQGLRAKVKQPIKVVIDNELKIPLKSKIFSKNSPAKVIIATTKKAAQRRIDKFRRIGAEVLILGGEGGRINLEQLMKTLAKREITSLLVEGGGETIGSLVDAKLVDKFLFFITPKVIGGKNAITSVGGEGVSRITQALVLKELSYKRFGADLLIEGYAKCSQV